MTDKIRADAAGGLTITRLVAARAGDPVVLGVDGFEVVDPRSNVQFEMIATALAVGASKVMNHVYSTSNITGKPLPRDAVLVGASVSMALAATAGTATLQLQRGGADLTGATVAIASGDQRKTAWWYQSGGFIYTAGQTVGALFITDGSFAPVASEIVNATLYFVMP